MLESLFTLAHARYRALPIVGSVLEELCEWLRLRGYPPAACRRRVAAAPFLEKSLRRRRVRSLRDCTASVLVTCVPRPRKWTGHMACALARSLKRYLQERGRLASTRPTRSGRLIAAYLDYAEKVRGLVPYSAQRHATTIAEFLRFLHYGDKLRSLRKLQPADIDRFLSKAGRGSGRDAMQRVTSRLRNFLRFLAAKGYAPPGLDKHVESPRRYRQEKIPRALQWESVLRLLRSIDRTTAKGRRDYAILILIATYGLRRGEIAAIELDHIDWRARVIRFPRTKVGIPLVLPLTDEVATALLDYLRNSRPESGHRQVFLGVRVPRVPIEPTAIYNVFVDWATRAKIVLPPGGGPHCLRHSLAMRLLRQGTPLKSIGDILGHRSSESTCLYIRLDVEDLREVALPLPRAALQEVLP